MQTNPVIVLLFKEKQFAIRDTEKEKGNLTIGYTAVKRNAHVRDFRKAREK